jgi:hypothetical protein
MGINYDRGLPLTKRVHALGFASRGLAILSHKGRGKVPQAQPSLVAKAVQRVFLAPCGRGYAGRVSETNPWPELVRGGMPHNIGAAA